MSSGVPHRRRAVWHLDLFDDARDGAVALPHVRHDRARCDRVEADAMRPVLHRKRTGQCIDGALRRRVRRPSRRAALRRHRRHVDHRPAGPFDHRRHERGGEQEQVAHVEAMDIVDGSRVELGGVRADTDAGVVHEDVDMTELGDCLPGDSASKMPRLWRVSSPSHAGTRARRGTVAPTTSTRRGPTVTPLAPPRDGRAYPKRLRRENALQPESPGSARRRLDGRQTPSTAPAPFPDRPFPADRVPASNRSTVRWRRRCLPETRRESSSPPCSAFRFSASATCRWTASSRRARLACTSPQVVPMMPATSANHD